MSQSSITSITPHSLSDIDDVMQALERIEHELPLHKLSRVRNFNRTYLIITRQVRQHIRKNSFKDDGFLQNFDTRFAYYYIDALQRYLAGRPTPAAWYAAFESSFGTVSSFASMALGVNAHVNNDIPQVLRDCGADKKHYDDYKLINKIISDSIHETLAELAPDSNTPTLSFRRKYLLRPYKFVMSKTIIIWRALAWHNYKFLRKGTMGIKHIESFAGSMAFVIRKLPI